MKNLIILYNPYYNQEVIEDHIRILNQGTNILEAKVAFGKVRSKRRDYEHPFEDKVDALCDAVRGVILGVGQGSIMSGILKNKRIANDC